MHVGAGGVLDRRRQVADYRPARVLGAPVGVVGRVPGHDGVAEAGALERRLPVHHPLLQVRHPLGRRGRVDVVDDRLDRVHQLAPGERLRVAGLQTPAGYEALRDGSLLVEPVVDLAGAEEADPLVAEPRFHWVVGQRQHRVVHLHGKGVAGRVGGRLGGFVGDHAPHLHVGREGRGANDVSPVPVQPPHAELLPAELGQPQQRHVAGEQVRDVRHERRRVVRHDLHVERRDDRLEVGVAHRRRHRRRVAREVLVAHQPQQHAVAVSLPTNGGRVGLGAAVARAVGGARHPGQQEHLLAQHLQRDLVEQLVVDPVGVEQPLAGDRVLGDHVGVGLGLFRLLVLALVGLLLFFLEGRRQGKGRAGRKQGRRGQDGQEQGRKESGKALHGNRPFGSVRRGRSNMRRARQRRNARLI